MLRLLIISLILFTFLEALAQVGSGNSVGINTGSNVTPLSDLQLIGISSSASKTLTYDQIEGSPYIDNNSGANNNLPLGKFYTSDHTFITTAFVRYNAYTDDMEVSLLEDGVDYYLLKKQADFHYIVLRKKQYRAFKHKGKMEFFVILSENDKNTCTLLLKEKVVFKKADRPKSSFITAAPDRFSRLNDVLYFKFNNGIAEIPKKKKLFYQLFGEYQDRIKEYVETNQLKFSREKDLLQIATYYNAINNK